VTLPPRGSLGPALRRDALRAAGPRAVSTGLESRLMATDLREWRRMMEAPPSRRTGTSTTCCARSPLRGGIGEHGVERGDPPRSRSTRAGRGRRRWVRGGLGARGVFPRMGTELARMGGTWILSRSMWTQLPFSQRDRLTRIGSCEARGMGPSLVTVLFVVSTTDLWWRGRRRLTVRGVCLPSGQDPVAGDLLTLVHPE